MLNLGWQFAYILKLALASSSQIPLGDTQQCLLSASFSGFLSICTTKDHNPPHFHVRYAEFEASVRFDTLEITNGYLPKRVVALVLEWAAVNREALATDWQLAQKRKPLSRIDPLR